MARPFVLAQISDTHVEARPRRDGYRPSAGLRAAMARPELREADALLLTGDLVDDGAPEAYEVLLDLLADWRKPLFALNGNHDEREAFRAAFAAYGFLPETGDCSFCVEDLPFRLVALDAVELDRVGGLVTPERAAWLEAALAAKPDRPTMLALHFPPTDTLDPKYETHGLAGADLLAGVLARHPQIVRVVSGHLHELGVATIAGAVAIAAPSTAWRYGPHAFRDGAPPRREPGPTGFLLHLFDEARGFATHGVWL